MTKKWLLASTLAAALGYYLYCASIGWWHTILDAYGFRQTQTAITAYYAVLDGFRLSYLTPVLGPPWSIPMEFPLYQWVVAAGVRLFGTPLDQTGRTVSVVFHLLTLVPLYCVLEEFKVRRLHRVVALSLLLASPLYILYSRSFMIETCALFLSLSFLCVSLRTRRGWQYVVLAGALGSLAAVVKITTFIPYAVAAALCAVVHGLRNKSVRSLCGAALAGGVSLAAGLVWTAYADTVKEQNPLGHYITSGALRDWNFGSLSQKFDHAVWATVYERMSYVTGVGTVAPVAAVLLVALVCGVRRERLAQAAACLAMFCFAPVLFTNLYFAHDYYFVANGIFLLLAVAFPIIGMLEKRALVGVVCLHVCLLGMAYGYVEHYGRRHQTKNIDAHMAFCAQLKERTPPGAVNVLVGLDWDSMIPYYSERKALMLPEWKHLGLTETSVRHALRNVAKERVANVVFAGRSMWSPRAVLRMMQEEGVRPGHVYVLR